MRLWFVVVIKSHFTSANKKKREEEYVKQEKLNPKLVAPPNQLFSSLIQIKMK